jgi:hypothetical protein
MMSPGQATTVLNLPDAEETILSETRAYKDPMAMMVNLGGKVNLRDNTGNERNEIRVNPMSAQSVNDTQRIFNPALLSVDTSKSRPHMINVTYALHWKIRRRLIRGLAEQFGRQAKMAITRNQDQSGLITLQSASESLGANGTAMKYSHLESAHELIMGSEDQDFGGPPVAIMHPRALRPVKLALAGSATLGNATPPYIPAGMSQDIIKMGMVERIDNMTIYLDRHTPITSAGNSTAGVFVPRGILLTRGRADWSDRKHEPDGGGTDYIYLFSEFGWTITQFSLTTHIVKITTTASKPTG